MSARPAERYVLDSHALLAYFEAEPGAEVVESLLAACSEGSAASWLSIVNYGEILYITEREQGLNAAQRAVALIDQLPVEVVVADRDLTFTAAHVKAHHAVSYADAFAIALAQMVSGRVVTGDPEFRKAEALVPIEWIGAP